MTAITLKSLHHHLRLLENAPELKRRIPVSIGPRTLKEGLDEMSRLLGADAAVFKDAQTIAALIGDQRFVMIWGEPSATDQVARVFDSARLLLSGLVSTVDFENPTTTQLSAGHQQGGAMAALSPSWAQPNSEAPAAPPPPPAGRETSIDDLKTLFSGNVPLTCRLFRALFEHLLGFAPPSRVQQGNAALMNELTGGKEHGRSFRSTALFILGTEVERDHLMSFMMREGLFGIPVFEHMLQDRDYCEAYHSFRHLERAFMGSPVAEETQIRNRLDKFNAQFGGKPCGVKLFEAGEQDKARVDAYLAATDLLEALALTPWCMSLNNAVSVGSSNSVRSVSLIARHFEHFGRGEVTKDQANREIADHLLAFARQFSADSRPV